MRKAGNGPRNKITISESVATPSMTGSFFGTKDTKMGDVEFDMPNIK